MKRLIIQKEANKKCAYKIALCKIGIFTEIWLDDLFPTKNKKFKFCIPVRNQIWAMLLEKAYSKLYGAYWNAGCGGHATHALKDLTGAPAECIFLDEKSPLEIFDIVKKAMTNEYPITASTKKEAEEQNNGMAAWHAYTILGAYKTELGRFLLKLRDPWGKNGWNGEWGVNCSKWNELSNFQREKLEVEKFKAPGVFYIPIQNFKEIFTELEICYYEDDYIYTQKLNPPTTEPLQYLQIIIKKPGKYYFSVSQPDKRLLLEKDDCFASFVLLRCEQDSSMKYIDGISAKKRDIFIKTNLKEGVYCLIVNYFYQRHI